MRIISFIGFLLILGGRGLSAREAIINPVLWDPAFNDTAVSNTVGYVYFTVIPAGTSGWVYTGDTVFYHHVITDSGSYAFQIDLADSSHHYVPTISSYIYHDVNGNGMFEAGTDVLINNTSVLNPNQSYSILIGLVVPEDGIPDSTRDTIRVICTSATNPAWKDTILDYTTIRIRTAQQVLAALSPNAAVAGSSTVFTYRWMPLDGSADEFRILNPFTTRTMRVDSIRVGATALTIDSSSTRPVSDHDASWYYTVATDTLVVLLNSNRVKDTETLYVRFTETMPTTPVDLDSFVSFFTGTDIAEIRSCSTATGTQWDITVVPGRVSYYLVTPDNPVQQAGVEFTVTLVAKDQFGNTVTNYDTTGLTFFWAGPGSAPDGTAPQYPPDRAIKDSLISTAWDSTGKGRVRITLFNAEKRRLTFGDVVNAAQGHYDSVQVTPQVSDSVAILYPTVVESVLAGGTIQPEVAVYDQYANPVSDTTKVAWSFIDPAPANGGSGETFSQDTTITSAGQSLVTFYPSAVAGDDYRVTATVDGRADTSARIVIRVNDMMYIKVVYNNPAGDDTIEAGDTTITTDFDSLRLVAVGYDSADNYLGAQNAAWARTGDPIGPISPATGSWTRLEATTPGAARIIAFTVTSNDTFYDTSGTITVLVGSLDQLVIAPTETTLTADDTVVFTATGFDADGNGTSVLGNLTWSGGGAIGTINSGTGRFEAVTVGGDTIRVASDINGVTDKTGLITVLHGTIDSLAVTPAAATITADGTRQFTATAYDADRNSWSVTDTGAGTAWSTNDGSGTVVNGLYTPVQSGSYLVWAVNTLFTDTSTVLVLHGAIAGLDVVPDSAWIPADSTLRLRALATDADGNIWDVTDSASITWREYDPNITSVSGGVYNPVRTGTFMIEAFVGAYFDTSYVVVRHGAIDSLEVTPNTASLSTDSTLRLAATAFDAEGNSWVVTDSAATAWGTDPGATVAAGLFDPDSMGIFRVWAVNNGVSDTSLVTIAHGQIVSLTVLPAAAVVTTDSGLILQAVAADADGNTWDVTADTNTTWGGTGSTQPVIGGSYYADRIGSQIVYASQGGYRDTCYVTVNYGAVAQLVLAPQDTIVTADDSIFFTATAYDRDGNGWDITINDTVTWYGTGSARPVVRGLFYADTAGSRMVTAGYHGIADTALVTVTHGVIRSLAVDPATASISADATLAVRAYAFDADGNQWEVTGQAGTQWNATGTTQPVANGIYDPDSSGTHRVWATNSGYSDTCVVNVQSGALNRLEISPRADTLTADDSLVLTVTAFDQDGNWWEVTLSDSTNWKQTGSRDSVINGIYRADTAGGQIIVVTYQGYTDTCRVVVAHGIIVRMVVQPGRDTLTADDSLAVAATATDADGNQWDVTDSSGTIWSGTGSAQAITGGLYFADTTGNHIIVAQNSIYIDTCRVLVTHGAVVSLDVTPDSSDITSDSTLALTAIAYDADSNAWEVTADSLTVWGTDDSVVITNGYYNPSGMADFLVWAVYDGAASDTSFVRVTEGIIVRIEIVPADTQVTADDIVPYQVVAFDKNNKPWEVTGLVTWRVDTLASGQQIGRFLDTSRFNPTVASVKDTNDQLIPWRVYAAIDSIDTFATITVVPGDTNHIRIDTRPDGQGVAFTDTTVKAGSRLALYAGIYDADTNFVGNVVVDWTRIGTTDSLSALAGSSTVFFPRRVGTCRIRASHADLGSDLTGTITIVHADTPAYYLIRVSRLDPDVNSQVACSLVVKDAFGNTMTDYDTSLYRIDIEVLVDSTDPTAKLERLVRFLDPAGEVVNLNNAGYLPAGSHLTGGIKVIYIVYSATEESLYFRFTERTTNVTGISPGIVWKDPELLSHLYMYPVPINVGQGQLLTISYVLRYNSTVYLRIFTLEGNLVLSRVFEEGRENGRAGPNELTWDGTNQRGRFVGSGGYIVKMWIDSEDGQTLVVSRKIGVTGGKR